MHADSYMHSLSVFCSERPGRSRGGRQREGDIGGVVGGGWKSASAVRAARAAAAAAAAAAARASEGGPGGEGVAARRRRRGGDGDRRGRRVEEGRRRKGDDGGRRQVRDAGRSPDPPLNGAAAASTMSNCFNSALRHDASGDLAMSMAG